MTSMDTRLTGKDWHALWDKRVAILFALGFSAGLPLLLIFGTLSIRLQEAGVARDAITFFSWAALGYGFKFVWAPLLDHIVPPLTGRFLGFRRGWLIYAQVAVAIAIIGMAFTDPASGATPNMVHGPVAMAFWAVLLGFSAATQDIVIDAYRIEVAPERLQGALSASYIAGYRVGMIAAGAGALEIAGAFDIGGKGTGAYSQDAWQWAYLVMAGFMSVGLLTTALMPEPDPHDLEMKSGINPVHKGETQRERGIAALRLAGVFVLGAIGFILTFIMLGKLLEASSQGEMGSPIVVFIREAFRLLTSLFLGFLVGWAGVWIGLANRRSASIAFVQPVREFFKRYGKAALLVVALISFYRIADIVMGTVANLFYIELGFEKETIGRITKAFGLIMTLAGGFLGGVLIVKFGILRVLTLGAILAAGTNLLFAWMADGLGAPGAADIRELAIVVAADNLSAGIAGAAFVAYLSALTNTAFTASQYALFSSMTLLMPKLVAGYSGSIVTGIGYGPFFVMTATLGLPAVVLIALAYRYAPLHQRNPDESANSKD